MSELKEQISTSMAEIFEPNHKEESPQSRTRVVVVALDSSAPAANALEWALENVVDVARDHVVLLTVSVLSDRLCDLLESAFGTDAVAGRLDQLQAAETAKAQETLDSAAAVINAHADRLGASARISHEIFALRSGDPREIICNYCAKRDAALLVLGSRGLGSVGRMWLGSVSDYCAHNAPCPVAIVKLG